MLLFLSFFMMLKNKMLCAVFAVLSSVTVVNASTIIKDTVKIADGFVIPIT